MKPTIGRIVHYTSYGTPGGEYPKTCRAAVITAVEDDETVSLFVMNPEGVFLNQAVKRNDGAETPGDPDCPQADSHGSPHRYCPCGWIEAHAVGGTWHWPERVES